jgi:hypothetical protein
MTSKTWGLASETPPEDPPVEPGRKRVALTPQAANAAHKGIVWIHASAIVVWLIVTVTLGALLVAGKHVPVVVVVIGVAAALGHTLFLATHLMLARMAKRRAAAG